uniref:Uncharacterized protein n=1 Tax=Trichuris muris TaxID=70415 RepID=A0A5S6R378_TRIMR
MKKSSTVNGILLLIAGVVLSNLLLTPARALALTRGAILRRSEGLSTLEGMEPQLELLPDAIMRRTMGFGGLYYPYAAIRQRDKPSLSTRDERALRFG